MTNLWLHELKVSFYAFNAWSIFNDVIYINISIYKICNFKLEK